MDLLVSRYERPPLMVTGGEPTRAALEAGAGVAKERATPVGCESPSGPLVGWP